jgi:hypothetical protein
VASVAQPQKRATKGVLLEQTAQKPNQTTSMQHPKPLTTPKETYNKTRQNVTKRTQFPSANNSQTHNRFALFK